jgi:hypothetical protein
VVECWCFGCGGGSVVVLCGGDGVQAVLLSFCPKELFFDQKDRKSGKLIGHVHPTRKVFWCV